MKTTDLIELQKTITQGDWHVLDRYTDRNAIPIARKLDENAFASFAECNGLGGVTGQTEGDANARAIALTPKLIAEVIKLREALRTLDKASTNYFYGDNRVAATGSSTHMIYCDAKRQVAAALENS